MTKQEWDRIRVQFISDASAATRAEFPEIVDLSYNPRRVPVVIRQIDGPKLLEQALYLVDHDFTLMCKCAQCEWKRVKADEFYLQYNKPSHVRKR